MGLFGGRNKFAGLTLAQLHATPPPEWCLRAANGMIQIDSSGDIPYILRSQSYFGPEFESWFSALLAGTFAQAEGSNYHFLLRHYTAMLTGLGDILTLGWNTWQNDEPGKSHALTHNPHTGDAWDMFSIPLLRGSLQFLKKAAEQHNRLLAAKGAAAAPWDPGFLDFKQGGNPAGFGVVRTRTQTVLEIRATPCVLQREVDRLTGRSNEPAIPAPAAPGGNPVPSGTAAAPGTGKAR